MNCAAVVQRFGASAGRSIWRAPVSLLTSEWCIQSNCGKDVLGLKEKVVAVD